MHQAHVQSNLHPSMLHSLTYAEVTHVDGRACACMHGYTSLSKDLVKYTRGASRHPSKTLNAWSDHGAHLHACHA